MGIHSSSGLILFGLCTWRMVPSARPSQDLPLFTFSFYSVSLGAVGGTN